MSGTSESRRELFRRKFAEGVAHFNDHRFWDAHESWEEIWLEAGSETHLFLQGLIQLAAAYHHIQRGTYSGAIRLIAAGTAKLAPFPADHCGLDRAQAVLGATEHGLRLAGILEGGGEVSPTDVPSSELPRLRLHDRWDLAIPEHW